MVDGGVLRDLAVQVAGQLVNRLQLAQDHAAAVGEAEDEAGGGELFLYMGNADEGIKLGLLGLPVGGQDPVTLALAADEGRAALLPVAASFVANGAAV
ncbi:hypothetical protein [Pseudomonas aeruginosa]|uniref:hypothetical protein n=1 Tax=Pseudomonas aeruginosa TaxID=287 RepID=UPI002A6B4436|nr:hypothetical protein [Pseudomonas aeruginosa]MDY1310914.1 hypothetical protein [Pseudomonas aeruginosa]MDY1425431.1 hypothetical protein [Pseudomonas aeruginosa]MDY1480223.1 hypothetical protein [Pseudomonas aeruginosa]